MTSYTQLNLTLCSQVTKNNTLHSFCSQHIVLCVCACACACAWIVDDNVLVFFVFNNHSHTHRHLLHELLQNLSLVKVLMCWWLLNAQHNVTAALCYSWQPWCSILPQCFPWMLYSLGSHPPLYLSAHLAKNTVRSIYDVIRLAGSELHHGTCTHTYTHRLLYSSILLSHLSRSGHNGSMLSGGNQRSSSIVGLLFSVSVDRVYYYYQLFFIMEQLRCNRPNFVSSLVQLSVCNISRFIEVLINHKICNWFSD